MTTPNPALEMALRHLLQHSREFAVIVLDPQGKVVGWFGAAQELLGYSAEEIVGRPGSDIFTAADKRKGFDELELAIARDTGSSQDDRWHLRKDGMKVWVSGCVEAVRDAAGAVIAYVKFLRDRTDLHMQMENLESRLRGREAASQRTGAFLRTLGNELREPLGSLDDAARIVESTNDDPRADKPLDVIFGRIDVLARLANELVEIAQLEAGDIKLELARHDIRAILAETHQEFRDDATRKGVNLVLMVPRGPLWADLDKSRFHQVLHHFVSNALKTTPTGGSVWIKLTQEGRHLLVRVEDTGAGISPEQLTQLFELFSRRATDLASTGADVGLSIVCQLVELHRGSVQARSLGEGKGAEFTVRIPAADLGGQAPGEEH